MYKVIGVPMLNDENKIIKNNYCYYMIVKIKNASNNIVY